MTRKGWNRDGTNRKGKDRKKLQSKEKNKPGGKSELKKDFKEKRKTVDNDK